MTAEAEQRLRIFLDDAGDDPFARVLTMDLLALLNEVTRLRDAQGVWAQVLGAAEKLSHVQGGAPSGVYSLQLTGDVLQKLRGVSR
jgi:hypothetical protein